MAFLITSVIVTMYINNITLPVLLPRGRKFARYNWDGHFGGTRRISNAKTRYYWCTRHDTRPLTSHFTFSSLSFLLV